MRIVTSSAALARSRRASKRIPCAQPVALEVADDPRARPARAPERAVAVEEPERAEVVGQQHEPGREHDAEGDDAGALLETDRDDDAEQSRQAWT
jgi:hypothetical protein